MKKFRDKRDLPVLPEIPEYFSDQIQILLHGLQFKNESSVRKLESIYGFLDNYGKFVEGFSVCSKGCAYCCHIDVGITELEAELIEERSGRKRKKPQGPPSVNSSSKCPFLGKNNYCSIYQFRPFNCRTFHTLDDPKYCKTGEDHQVYGSWGGQYTVTFYAKLNEVIQYLNKNKPPYDIRDYYG